MKINKQYREKPKRDVSFWKPRKFKHYLTLKELAAFVERDPSLIRALEKEGKILSPARVKRGKISIRLYSPEQSQEIKDFFSTRKRGRRAKEAETS